jgi:xanthine dehydrogenase YagT iron-sulfur-binding subunit
MSKKSKSEGISRRKFIKGFGGGVVGGSVLVHSLPVFSGDKKTGQGPQHEGTVPLALKVNGKPVKLLVEPRMTLAEVLRDQLNLTGTKITCNHGECGGCTVLLDGKAVYSCHFLVMDAADKDVMTIEGLLDGEKLHPTQEAFIEYDGYQCGFCTPGQIMAAQALLIKNPKPTRAEVKEGMSGNLCRCSAYPNIIDSVLAAAEKKMD